MSWEFLLNPAGHGPYILASYGISFVVLGWNVLASVVQARNLRREIRNEIRARRARS
jgi:heme exporter protein CcmD